MTCFTSCYCSPGPLRNSAKTPQSWPLTPFAIPVLGLPKGSAKTSFLPYAELPATSLSEPPCSFVRRLLRCPAVPPALLAVLGPSVALSISLRPDLRQPALLGSRGPFWAEPANHSRPLPRGTGGTFLPFFSGEGRLGRREEGRGKGLFLKLNRINEEFKEYSLTCYENKGFALVHCSKSTRNDTFLLVGTQCGLK